MSEFAKLPSNSSVGRHARRQVQKQIAFVNGLNTKTDAPTDTQIKDAGRQWSAPNSRRRLTKGGGEDATLVFSFKLFQVLGNVLGAFSTLAKISSK